MLIDEFLSIVKEEWKSITGKRPQSARIASKDGMIAATATSDGIIVPVLIDNKPHCLFLPMKKAYLVLLNMHMYYKATGYEEPWELAKLTAIAMAFGPDITFIGPEEIEEMLQEDCYTITDMYLDDIYKHLSDIIGQHEDKDDWLSDENIRKNT